MGTLHWLDYVIFVAFIVASLGIGVYHSVTGGRQRTTAEFIMANRNLRVLPTVLSLVASYKSAILILGSTAEMYNWGYGAWILGSVTTVPAAVIAERIFVPWIYPLRLTSVFEYLEMRYHSKSVTMLGAALGIASAVTYMGTAIFAPSIALEAACGIPVSVSIPVMALLATAYTVLGGMKAVIWTDVMQITIMLVGMLSVFIKAAIEMGGLSEAVRYAAQHGRFTVSFDPDLTVRHTVWGFLFGYALNWVSVYGLSQASVQRYSATKSLRDARITIFSMIPMSILMWGFAYMTGILVFGYFAREECDPLASGQITTANQILPLFVTIVLRDMVGFNGLFLATLYSGALSSVSSSLSGCAANTWESIIVPLKPGVSDRSATVVNKCLVVFFGILAIGIAFLAATMPGPVIQITFTLGGAVGGPLLGLFLAAGIFPFAEWKGALVGTLSSLILNIVVGVGARFVPPVNTPLPPVSTDGCQEALNSTLLSYSNTSFSLKWTGNDTTSDVIYQPAGIDYLFSISYLWYKPLGCVVCMAVTSAVSALLKLLGAAHGEPVPPKLLINWGAIFRCDDQSDASQKDGALYVVANATDTAHVPGSKEDENSHV